MSLNPKRWLINPAPSPDMIAPFQYFHPIVAQILYQRGYTDPHSAQAFLDGDMPSSDVFKMKGINKAIPRIRRAIDKQELIIVYGDFDADGVTSTALLVTALSKLGANVRHYIPHR